MSLIDQIEVLEENSNFIAILKPAYITVHRIKHLEIARSNKNLKEHSDEVYLTDWIINRYPETGQVGDDPEYRPGIVHRLDKETSGVLIIARNEDFFLHLKQSFQNGEVKKKYQALVYGEVKNDVGIISKPIGLLGGSIKRTVHGGKMIKEAVTEYKVIHRYKDFTLLEISPKTGRTHQIRVHLASIGHPIVGDKLYGGKKEKKSLVKIGRQFLHAYQISFKDEVGVLYNITAQLPADLTEVLKEI